MKILISNDDGISSPGIIALHTALSKKHEVLLVAPDQERSGSSHSLTLVSPIRINRLENNRYSCSGTPADCILYTLLGAIDFKPDCVLSGINRGPNLGTDLIYSGTVAAARQAALAGIPAIAFSSECYHPPFEFTQEAHWVASHLESLVNLCKKRSIININFPKEMIADCEMEVTFPAVRHYNDHLQVIDAADKSQWFFLSGEPLSKGVEDGSDWHAILNKKISFSSILIDPQLSK